MEKEVIKKIFSEESDLVDSVYEDLLHPSVQEIGLVLKRTVRWILSPLRLMLWNSQPIEEVLEEGITKRLNNVPENNLKIPDPEVSIPIIQSLTYRVDNEPIRELILNILAKSMDKRNEKKVHPFFVEIIKQMNSLDVKVFSKLFEISDVNFEIISPRLYLDGENIYYYSDLPNWFIGWKIEEFDYFDVSMSLKRLAHFGLIDLYPERSLKKVNDHYKDLESHPFLKNQLEKSIQSHGKPIILKCNRGVLSVNELGLQFGDVCLKD